MRREADSSGVKVEEAMRREATKRREAEARRRKLKREVDDARA